MPAPMASDSISAAGQAVLDRGPHLGGAVHHLEDRAPPAVADLVAGRASLAAEELQLSRPPRRRCRGGRGSGARAARRARGRCGRSGGPGAGRSRRRASRPGAGAARPSPAGRHALAGRLGRAARPPRGRSRRAAWRGARWRVSGIDDSTTTSGRTATTERSVSSIFSPRVSDSTSTCRAPSRGQWTGDSRETTSRCACTRKFMIE